MKKKEGTKKHKHKTHDLLLLTCFVSDDAFGAHGSPGIKEIQSPLTVADEEGTSIEAGPALLLEHKLIKAMHDKIVFLVFLKRNLEQHIREHGIAIHPPDPLHLRMPEHQLPDERKLSPKPSHLCIQMSHVVEDFDVVETTVVDLVLDGHEKVVISHGIFAGGGLRARDKKHSGLSFGRCGDVGMHCFPCLSLLIPVCDHRTQSIRFVRIVAYLVFIVFVFFEEESLGRSYFVLFFHLSKNSARPKHHSTGCRLEMHSDFLKVLCWCPELSSSYCSSQHQDRHQAAHDCYFQVPHCSLQSSSFWRRQESTQEARRRRGRRGRSSSRRHDRWMQTLEEAQDSSRLSSTISPVLQNKNTHPKKQRRQLPTSPNSKLHTQIVSNSVSSNGNPPRTTGPTIH